MADTDAWPVARKAGSRRALILAAGSAFEMHVIIPSRRIRSLSTAVTLARTQTPSIRSRESHTVPAQFRAESERRSSHEEKSASAPWQWYQSPVSVVHHQERSVLPQETLAPLETRCLAHQLPEHRHDVRIPRASFLFILLGMTLKNAIIKQYEKPYLYQRPRTAH